MRLRALYQKGKKKVIERFDKRGVQHQSSEFGKCVYYRPNFTTRYIILEHIATEALEYEETNVIDGRNTVKSLRFIDVADLLRTGGEHQEVEEQSVVGVKGIYSKQNSAGQCITRQYMSDATELAFPGIDVL